MHDGQLFVFEDHKHLQWEFTLNGIMLSNAVSSNLKRDGISYIAKTYGVRTEKDLAELNDYRRAGKR